MTDKKAVVLVVLIIAVIGFGLGNIAAIINGPVTLDFPEFDNNSSDINNTTENLSTDDDSDIADTVSNTYNEYVSPSSSDDSASDDNSHDSGSSSSTEQHESSSSSDNNEHSADDNDPGSQPSGSDQP